MPNYFVKCGKFLKGTCASEVFQKSSASDFLPDCVPDCPVKDGKFFRRQVCLIPVKLGKFFGSQLHLKFLPSGAGF